MRKMMRMRMNEGEGEGEGSERISLFDRPQNEIMKLIFAVNYLVPDEGHASFDVHAIFSTSQKIIKDSANIIHNIIEQGSGFNDVETPKASSSLCTLVNSFGCKTSCKSPGDETAFESRTEEILTRLSSYPCEVQVVLALAIFALEYEECSSQLSKKSTTLKRQDAVVELNNLVNQALQVIEHILELEKLISGDRDSEPKLARVIMDTPFNAFWSIITLVACTTELSLLTGDEDIKSYDLSPFSQKMGFILNKLDGQLTICQQEKEEAKAKEKFWELIRTAPPEITEVFQRLVLFKHKAYPQPPIISVNPTSKEVFNIDALRGKCVLFYISSLDNVSDQDILCLKEVYEGIDRHNKRAIVWIPVVEDWTEGGEEQFKEWRSKMPWYAVQYFLPPAIGYLEQRWNFKGNPMVVVMNQTGIVVNTTIIDLIRTQATEAIALLNLERRVHIRGGALFVPTAEAVEELKRLTCPQQSTPVLLDGSNKQVNIDNELKWKHLFLLLSDVGIEDCYISYLKPVYEGIRRYDGYRIVWVPILEQWNKDKEKQLEMSRLKMPWYTLKCFSTIPGIKYMKEKWNYKGKPAVVVMTSEEEAKAKAEEEFWKQIRTAPYEITEVFQRLVLFKHKAYPQPPIISVNPTNKEVFNINVLEWKWVLFYISSLDNVSDQEISCLKEVYEGIEERNECVIVWIPVVEDWTEGGEEQFKEWRSKMPWYAVQYFSPPASGYLEQRWNFKGNPMVVVMNWEGEVAISNIIDLIRTQATKAIALLNVKMQKEIPRVEAAQSSFGTNAEAVEVLKSLTCPRQFTNTDATPVLLDGSNKQVNIDNELKWKDLFLLLSDIGIDYCYISYLKPVYEGIRRYPSYRIVWVPVVEQWNQDKG
ncbi:hypothetical protein ACFX2B_043773 [Malus domestica]